MTGGTTKFKSLNEKRTKYKCTNWGKGDPEKKFLVGEFTPTKTLSWDGIWRW